MHKCISLYTCAIIYLIILNCWTQGMQCFTAINSDMKNSGISIFLHICDFFSFQSKYKTMKLLSSKSMSFSRLLTYIVEQPSVNFVPIYTPKSNVCENVFQNSPASLLCLKTIGQLPKKGIIKAETASYLSRNYLCLLTHSKRVHMFIGGQYSSQMTAQTRPHISKYSYLNEAAQGNASWIYCITSLLSLKTLLLALF